MTKAKLDQIIKKIDKRWISERANGFMPDFWLAASGAASLHRAKGRYLLVGFSSLKFQTKMFPCKSVSYSEDPIKQSPFLKPERYSGIRSTVMPQNHFRALKLCSHYQALNNNNNNNKTCGPKSDAHSLGNNAIISLKRLSSNQNRWFNELELQGPGSGFGFWCCWQEKTQPCTPTALLPPQDYHSNFSSHHKNDQSCVSFPHNPTLTGDKYEWACIHRTTGR